MAYAAVMVVGAFGCAARMWLGGVVSDRLGHAFPFGTLAVNIFGCLLIGLFAGATRDEGGWLLHPIVRQAVMIGFLGGFTTFSAFGLQTITLVNDGEWGLAALYVAASVVLCLLAVWVGQFTATAIVRA